MDRGFEHKTFWPTCLWPVSAHKGIWTSDYDMRVSTDEFELNDLSIQNQNHYHIFVH